MGLLGKRALAPPSRPPLPRINHQVHHHKDVRHQPQLYFVYASGPEIVSYISHFRNIIMLISKSKSLIMYQVGPWGDGSLKLIGLGPLSPRWLQSHPGGVFTPP